MTADTTNDNFLEGRANVPDAHGQAAMLLVESLVHGLIARRVLTVADAVEIVDVAAEVKIDTAGELGDLPANHRKSLYLLTAISGSLRLDLPRD